MKDSEFRHIRSLVDSLDDLPDGAFLGVLEEMGVDVDDLARYAKEQGRRAANRSERKMKFPVARATRDKP